MTTDLTTWLLAQIAAEEERARAATDAFTRGVGTPPKWTSKRQWERFDPAISEQIRANDPAATLRRCAEYRAIMEIHTPRPRTVLGTTWDECPVCFDPDTAAGDYDFEGWPCGTLRALATIYADADGYDPSWRLG